MHQRSSRPRRLALSACCALAFSLLVVAAPAWGAYEGVPTPTVEGPIAETSSSHIFMRTKVPLAQYGYTEEEYFISGTGYTYSTGGAVTETGTKITTGGPNENGTYPFKTRIVVRRPIELSKFNGKVLAEWQNVTAGFDLEPEWDGDPYALMKAGYVYVAVDAQPVGVSGLKKYNSERYGSLEVGPSNGALAYDVWAAALKAIRGDGVGPTPLGNLTSAVTNVTASGASQSCSELATYYNKVAPLQEVANDFLMTDCTNAIRPERPPKVLRVISEFEGKLEQPASEFSNPSLRYWEVADGSHVPYMVQADWGPLIERDEGPAESYCTSTPILSEVEWPYAVDAGLRELIGWQEGGPEPPAAPEDEYVNSKTLKRNSLGIALGGLRLPEVEVPGLLDLAENSAHAAPNPYPFSAFCVLLGQHQNFSEETLNGLYKNYGEYVEKVAADAQKMVTEGFLEPEGAARIVDAAEEFPRLAPTTPQGSGSQKGSFQLSWRGPVPSYPENLVPKFVETHPTFEVQHRQPGGEWTTVASSLGTPTYSLAHEEEGTWSYRVRSTTVVPAQHMEPEETIVSPWSEASPQATVKVLAGSVKGKLTVGAGEALELTGSAKASGAVTVKPGGQLAVQGATLSGGVQATRAALVRICGAQVAGTVKATGGGTVVLGEAGGECPASVFHGSVTVKGNTGGVLVEEDAFDGSLSVEENAGGVTVTHNTVAGALTVLRNKGKVVDQPNEVEGRSKLQ
jgi:hypothetical protein